MLPRDEDGAAKAREKKSGESNLKSTVGRVSFIVTDNAHANVRLSSCFNRASMSNYGR